MTHPDGRGRHLLVAELMGVLEAVTATRSRTAKIVAIAELLAVCVIDELPVLIGLLLGKPRQGRLGIGYRSLQSAMPEAAAEPSLALIDVDAAFTELSATVGTGSGSTTRRAQILGELLARATADEQELITRVIVGEVRTGALEGVVTDAVARAFEAPAAQVRRAAMLSGNLSVVAIAAAHGDSLDTIGLVPGVPVLPMLAASAPTAAAAVAQIGEAVVEYKLDGARLQVHRVDGVVSAWTRSLADVTERVPELVELVSTFAGGDLILDGETLTLDESGAPRPFADTMSRFGARTAREATLQVQFFDVLHADGRDLIDAPLRERRAVLEQIAGAAVVRSVPTTDPEAAEQTFREAIAAGHEGVIVKAIDAPYAAGRRGSDWIKVKPVHTYDLVVLAAEWGYGRRSGWLSNLHLGARDPDGRFGEPGGFVMLGKTFKGLTDEILRWQTEYFPQIETRRTAGTVFVEPTTVVEIAIDGVQRSSRYPGGVALRFARVKRYRVGDDAKPAAEADTIDTLRALLPEPPD